MIIASCQTGSPSNVRCIMFGLNLLCIQFAWSWYLNMFYFNVNYKTW